MYGYYGNFMVNSKAVYHQSHRITLAIENAAYCFITFYARCNFLSSAGASQIRQTATHFKFVMETVLARRGCKDGQRNSYKRGLRNDGAADVHGLLPASGKLLRKLKQIKTKTRRKIK